MLLKVLLKRFVVALILIVAFFAIPQLGEKLDWSTPLPSLQEMGKQIKFAFRSLKGLTRFQRPSLSALSIPYLTIMEVREEASIVPQKQR